MKETEGVNLPINGINFYDFSKALNEATEVHCPDIEVIDL